MPGMHSTILQFATVFSIFSTAVAQTAYANDFVDPDYILAKNFSAQTGRAQATVVSWAKELASSGPWSVTNKPFAPASGDKHDYLSWAPYWWPDCSGVGNKTALTDQQIWVTCPYKSRDGQFNPDVRLVNNVGDFQDFSEAVFYNSIAWALGTADKDTFEANAVRFLRAWFLDPDTKMNPNLKYAQVQRGPGSGIGSHTGVLDLKGIAKITTGILILRKGGSTAWTTDLDNQMVSWAKAYTSWLQSDPLAIDESESTNNHGTFYFNQLAALKILANDMAGAKESTDKYFDGLYLAQIAANGDQPLESSRTRPYHYRAYNLAGMITNARLAKYADPSSTVWNKTTTASATIKSALDYSMTISAAASGESAYASELHPNVAAVASVYGDADGKYLAYLKRESSTFITQPYILWNQPFAQNETSGVAPPTKQTSSTSASKGTKSTSSTSKSSKPSSSSASRMGGVSVTLALGLVGVHCIFTSLL
ncbi:hypothetical protein GALMADRAFT_119999 [Galerina marginata CBS 339.88]|uniref:Alginate lyase domain-containing protein n=1 Tax=Galerina marginata (strain CBS 339.88) TaxID=685588 RepID=A0A067TDC3_GALM3|nr:hypothetical protein GALMADRAFT_119999 [Galerina marginata CBS 339.88]